jgi:hypothetical protein
MKKQDSADTRLERYSDIELQWCKVKDTISKLISDGTPEEHWVSLLTAARLTTAALNRIVGKHPELVAGIAEKESLWPFMVSPFKNDKAGYEFAHRIKLGAAVVKTTSKSPLTQLVSKVAVDILQTAHQRKKTADEYKKRSDIPMPLVRFYAAYAALPPLSHKTFDKWRVAVFKPEFDAMWNKIKDAQAWYEPYQTAKRNPNGNILEYNTEANLKNHARKRVMQALKALLPMA